MSREPVRKHYDVVIVGAGVQGLATAYELAKRGVTDVAVIDRSWPGGGASGRNGELIRSAFASREWCRFFDLSVQRFAGLSAELDFNVLFSPSGYLVLASTDQELSQQDDVLAAQAANGVTTEKLESNDVLRLMPSADPSLARGGIFQRHAGFAHHDAVVWAYARAAAARGVAIHTDIGVNRVLTSHGRAIALDTTAGEIHAGAVVNAAGGDAQDLNDTAGVHLPIIKSRLEMLVTEPLKPFLPCAVASPNLMGYCHQTARGEFVGGTELHQVDETNSLNTTHRLFRDMATKWVALFPALAGARVLRTWAGTVSQTADLAPVLGRAPGLEDLWISAGWVYGFMGAPAAGQLLAEAIDTGRVPELMSPFEAARLVEGRPIVETTLVVAPGAVA